MIQIGEILVSDHIRDVEFVCNLEKCKGACCVEGDLGAPLEEDELETMKAITPKVLPYMLRLNGVALVTSISAPIAPLLNIFSDGLVVALSSA